MSTFKWTDEVTAKLLGIVDGETPVSAETVNSAAEALGASVRSVAAKLRKLGHEVVSMAKTRTPAFSPEDTAALRAFVEDNAGNMTYAEIASAFQKGKFTPKEVQGKILSLELTAAVKKTEKVAVPRTYTPEQEDKFVKMVTGGSFVEEIAAAFGKTIESVRGKALSLLRSGKITALPKQKETHANVKADPVEAIMDKIAGMTVAEIVVALEKTERGVKTMLTRRGITCKDYDGAAKKAKSAAATPAA